MPSQALAVEAAFREGKSVRMIMGGLAKYGPAICTTSKFEAHCAAYPTWGAEMKRMAAANALANNKLKGVPRVIYCGYRPDAESDARGKGFGQEVSSDSRLIEKSSSAKQSQSVIGASDRGKPMLSTAINCKSPRLSRALPEVEESRAAPAAPPVIPVHPMLDPEQYPSAIFGNLPAGFDLGRADIRLLVHWQRKAIAAVENLPETANDDDLTKAMRPVNSVFKAIKCLTLDYPAGIALQIKTIAEVAEWFDGDSESSAMEDLSTAEFRHLAASLDAALVRPEPTKRVGPLTRGRKLTTAGLLHRYHAFLVQELETLGWKLYGSSEYALQMRPADIAVNERCSSRHGSKARRKIYPFFDESRLSARARTVLGSLEIDTERDGS